eukprot:198750-Amphidinium_carterae.3
MCCTHAPEVPQRGHPHLHPDFSVLSDSIPSTQTLGRPERKQLAIGSSSRQHASSAASTLPRRNRLQAAPVSTPTATLRGAAAARQAKAVLTPARSLVSSTHATRHRC